MDPFQNFSQYVPLRQRFVPVAETSAQVKVLAMLTQAEKHVMLVGGGGSGKSQFLRYFNSRVLPLLFSASADQEDPLEEFGSILATSMEGNPIGAGVSSSQVPSADSSRPVSPKKKGAGGKEMASCSSTFANQFVSETVIFNAASDSAWVQAKLDKMLEKRSGKHYAPMAGKKLVVVLENINLPIPDDFGSQSAHCLLRQFLEYGYWYDRHKLGVLKRIADVQLIGVMNPSMGSREMNDRFSHKFFTFGFMPPASRSVYQILQVLTQEYMMARNASHQMSQIVETCIEGMIETVDLVSKSFHPGVESFHYHFTLRDLIRITQGLITLGDGVPESIVPSLFVYESMAVLGGRLITTAEKDKCKQLVLTKARTMFHASIGLDAILGDKPLPVFAPFGNVDEKADGSFDPISVHAHVADHKELMDLVQHRMRATATITKFVLFDEALDNICQVCRLLSQPGSNAVIVGVSGSGKRSLAKLAADLMHFRVFSRETVVRQANSAGSTTAAGGGASGGAAPGGGTQDIRQDLARLFQLCTVKNQRHCLIVTQADLESWQVRQCVDEYLTTSYVDLFTPEEKSDVMGKISVELRGVGDIHFADSQRQFDYFKQKLANNFRILVCLSPFLSTLKPLLRSCGGFGEAQLVFFPDWPHGALTRVAHKVLFNPGSSLTENLSDRRQREICAHLASTHRTVAEVSDQYRKQERREAFITPKTFISYAQQCLSQLVGRREKLDGKKNRLRLGLDRLHDCRERVAVLQQDLGEYKKLVQQHALVASQLFEKVSSEKTIVEEQNRIAHAEEQKTRRIVEEVNSLVSECEADIRAAQPIVDAAKAALNTLNRPNLTELKTMNNPPEAVHAVTGCVMCILATNNRIPIDRSWAASRRMMADVPRWMKQLEDLDVNNIPDANIEAISGIVNQPWFSQQTIIRVSFAAASLCNWVVNVVKYHHIRVALRPKEARLAEAQSRLGSSQSQAKRVKDRCDALRQKLDELVRQSDEAQMERDRLESLLLQTEAKLSRAQRLLVSLVDERTRWAESIETVDDERQFLDGDSLFGAAFSAYCGPFSQEFRERLMSAWLRDLAARDIQCSLQPNPVSILFQELEDAAWYNEGLASASFMAHNAAITLSTNRWPMFIDPQHQGLRWLKGRSTARGIALTTLSSEDPELAMRMVECVSNGHLTVVELPAPFEVPSVLISLVEKRYHLKPASALPSSPMQGAGSPSGSPSGGGRLARRSSAYFGDTITARNSSPAQARRRASSVMFAALALGAFRKSSTAVTVQEGTDEGKTPSGDATDPAATNGTNDERGEIVNDEAFHMSPAQLQRRRSSMRMETFVDLGADHEAIVNPQFTLILRCVSANPTFHPDVFAQCNIVNFCVTEAALNEQLLSSVIKLEKPALEAERFELRVLMNRMTVELRDCENLLLDQLSMATGDLLENEDLVTTLETAKRKSVELSASLDVAQKASAQLAEALSLYHPISLRGSLMYMAVVEMCKVDPMYYYSIDLFAAQYEQTIAQCEERFAGGLPIASPQSRGRRPSGTFAAPALLTQASIVSMLQQGAQSSGPKPHEYTQEERIEVLIDAITRSLYQFVERSLFSHHKLIFALTVALTVLQRSADVDPQHVVYFLRGHKKSYGEPPKHVAEWLPKQQWDYLHGLAELEGCTPPFRALIDEALETTRWKQWAEMPRPETEKLPGEWKMCPPFVKLLLVRALRPDRLISACQIFLSETFLGKFYAEDYARPLHNLIDETPRCNPLLFVLTPGVDPELQVQQAASQLHMTNKLTIISMGQSQEMCASEAMERAATSGGWVLLHNVHLMKQWLLRLDHYVQQLVVNRDEGIHRDFRLFLSSEAVDHISSGLLQNCVKLVFEPPSGLRSNFLRAYQLFSHEPWEHCTKPHEFHLTVFSLCYFHAIVVERAKFGPVGWNRKYPFNIEDLVVCTDVLTTYLEDRPRVPWEDLRYMFGEIMYGGHITDQWDRRLCLTYLAQFISGDALDRHEIAPGVPLPTSRNYADTKNYIEELFPEESPTLYQLNPVSENRVRLREGRDLVAYLLDVIPTTVVRVQVPGLGLEDQRIDDLTMLIGAMPELIALDEVSERLGEDRTPFHHVFFQECERLNRLVSVMQRMLDSSEAAVRGTEAMSAEIDDFLLDVSFDRIPKKWAMFWGSTKRPLGSWMSLIGEASKQLNRWAMELVTPKLVNLTCLFVPIAFMGAILQDASLKMMEELDHMGLVVEVTKKTPQTVDLHSREGCYVFGGTLEGAAWDPLSQCLQDATVRDGMQLPVLILRAASVSKIDRSDSYGCPVYRTTDRASSFVTTLHLRTKLPSSTWILRGAAIILDGMF